MKILKWKMYKLLSIKLFNDYGSVLFVTNCKLNVCENFQLAIVNLLFHWFIVQTNINCVYHIGHQIV